MIRIEKRNREGGSITSSASYRYDALGRRIEKKTGTDVTHYLYDRDDIVLEYDGEDEIRAKYLHSNNTDEVLKMERNDSPYEDDAFNMQSFYYHRDRLGNVTEITDFEGTVVQRYVYDSFGRITIYDKDGDEITPESANYLKESFYLYRKGVRSGERIPLLSQSHP